MPVASSENAQLLYTVHGDGPHTVLMIMGLGGHATEWGAPLIGALEKRYRVLCMDNRGIGESTTTAASWTMQDMAADARAVLDAAGAETAYVIGTSMGGMIAQQLTLDAPERVQRLVLMSTMFGGPEVAPPLPPALALFGPTKASIGEQRRASLEALTTPMFIANQRELIESMVRLREQKPTSGRVFRAQMEAIFGSDRSKRVAQITVPTLVIHGTEDVLIPVQNGKNLAARIPGAKLRLIENCGHLPHIEYPELCAEEIIAFLG